MTKVTWEELANIYDAQHTGRKARTLSMDYVFNWAENQTELFSVADDGTLYLREEG